MILHEMMMRGADGVESGGGGAGAPAPATPATSAPAETTALSGGVSDFDIPDGDNLDSVVIGGAATEATQPVATASAPAPAPVVAPPPVAAPVAPPPPAVPAATASTAAAASEADGPIGIERMGEQLEQNRDWMLGQLEADYFQLTQEEVDGLQDSPEKVLPRLLSRALYHALTAIPHQIQQFVPGMIERETAKSAKSKSAAEEFYAVWPKIPRSADGTVAEALRTYKKMNPGATRADVIRVGGHMACLALGLDPAQMGTGAQGSSNGGRGGQNGASSAFVPAGSAATVPSVMRTDPIGENDEWGGFGLPNSGD